MSTLRHISRRRFLSMAGLAAVTPITAASASRVIGANDTLRIGVIGCGARGLALLEEIGGRKHPRASITAVCDVLEPRRQRAKALAGADLHHRWQDLVLRSDLDAVVIATPDHWHAPIAIAAMENGKDVYCERPMALDLDQAGAFRDAAVRTRRIVQIGAQETSEPQWHIANEILRSGAIGKVVWSQGRYARSGAEVRSGSLDVVSEDTLDWAAFHGSAAPRSFDPQRYVHWRRYWDYSGGIAAQEFYPKLAALLVALGSAFPTRVSAAGGVYAQDDREVPDSFVMTAQYPGGHTIVLASSMASAHDLPAVIRGNKATIELHGDAVKIVPETPSPAHELDAKIVRATPMTSHLDNWLECVQSRARCVCDEAIGYRTMVAIALAVEAYRRGRTLWFDPVTARAATSPPRATFET